MTETKSTVSRACTRCGRDILAGSRYVVDATGAVVVRLCRGCATLDPHSGGGE